MKPRVASTLFLALSVASSLTPEALAAAPRYRMALDPSQAEHGVKTVSLVQNPAIQRNWVTLAAVAPTAPAAKLFHLSSSDGAQPKQVLTGPALIPGQEILRLDEQGEPFYITFDAATIEATAIQFAAQGHHTSTNQSHAVGLEGNVVYESWIVVDAKKNKAAALGLAVEPGMWMLSVKIADPDYWQSEIVRGNVRGFSIEGLFEQQHLTLSAAQPTVLSSVKNWFQRTLAKLSALGPEQAAQVAALRLTLGLEQLADGRAVQIDDTTGAVCVCSADGTPGEALPDGSYPLQNGGELVVQGGVRVDGEQPVAAEGAAGAEGAASKQPAAPAALAETATTPDIVQAINGILDFIKQDAPAAASFGAASAPAAPKLAAALHKVALAELGPKLAELQLDAIELEDGSQLTYNAVTRQLTDKSGALVKSGYFAAKDGSYFSVSTDQYIYEISKPTYDAVYLQQVELAEVKAKLATEPAAGKVHLSGDGAAGAAAAGTKMQKVGLAATAHLREMQQAAAA